MNIRDLNKKELTQLIEDNKTKTDEALKNEAIRIKESFYGKKIFARGLIEFTNVCKNNCYYCGLRAKNCEIKRYRLTKDEILSCCDTGAQFGFQTFVLQGGEDLYYSEKAICDIIYSIKSKYPDCAVTLSIGEKTKKEYKSYFDAGADRFLLRHETANPKHYQMLHPRQMSLDDRKKCLFMLKEIGYQVGAGFMVGSPNQTFENLAEDLLFLKELEPEMVGIGPFLPHNKTPFKNEAKGSFELTITMLTLTRLLIGDVLLAATTALATLNPKEGRTKAFEVGANVVMPNLSPVDFRDSYSLYDNKLSFGNEAAQSINKLKEEIEKSGNVLDMSRGDNIKFIKK